MTLSDDASAAAVADAREQFRLFCPGCGYGSLPTYDEAQARKDVTEDTGGGCQPLVQRRLITTTEWESV